VCRVWENLPSSGVTCGIACRRDCRLTRIEGFGPRVSSPPSSSVLVAGSPAYVVVTQFQLLPASKLPDYVHRCHLTL
jgi:hypothetical protein